MDLHELDDKIDGLSIKRQLEILLRNLIEVADKLEISNHFWERAVAAEELLSAEEMKLFDSAADTLIHIRSLVGCRENKGREQENP